MSLCIAISPSSFAQDDDSPRRILEAAGCEIKENPYSRRLTEAEIIEHLHGVDGLIAGLEPLNRTVIASAVPRLKAIARVGIGVANVDFEAAEEFNVKISSTPDGPVNAVAEMTLAALLSIARGVIPANEALHRGEWKKTIGFGLEGLPVLLIGRGRIGSRVSGLLRAFGAEIMVCDPYVDASKLAQGEVAVSLEDGLAKAHVVSLHAGGESALLGADEFTQMHDGAVLLNSARGELVDENALIAALDSGKVKAAWFDAFCTEPYTGPLQDYPQVLMTPHVGTYTAQCRRSMETAAVQNLLRDLGLE